MKIYSQVSELNENTDLISCQHTRNVPVLLQQSVKGLLKQEQSSYINKAMLFYSNTKKIIYLNYYCDKVRID